MSDNSNVSNRSYKHIVSVRFKGNNKPYTFGTNVDDLEYGDYVVVETTRGTEMGEVVSSLKDASAYPSSIPLMPVLRHADSQDRLDYEENLDAAKDAFDFCNEKIKELKLNMNLISAEFTLDRRKCLFVYLADERVDFRELLKVLSSELGCRIELKQIGARDKAKIVGGIGVCGMECCCSRFLKNFDTVSINMAKNQLLALNVQKLSGQCGKLMCCLKYEDADYKQMTEGLPKMGAHVEFEGSIYRVTSMNVINNVARLENRDAILSVTLDELRAKAVTKKGQPVSGTGKKEDRVIRVSTPSKAVEIKPQNIKYKEVSAAEMATASTSGDIEIKEHTHTSNTNNNRRNDQRKNNHNNNNNNRNRNRNNRNNRPHQGLVPQEGIGTVTGDAQVPQKTEKRKFTAKKS